MFPLGRVTVVTCESDAVDARVAYDLKLIVSTILPLGVVNYKLTDILDQIPEPLRGWLSSWQIALPNSNHGLVFVATHPSIVSLESEIKVLDLISAFDRALPCES